MAGATRRHPNRPPPKPRAVKLTRVEHGHYRTDEGIDIMNVNAGLRDACWNAYDASGKRLTTAPTLRECCNRLAKVSA